MADSNWVFRLGLRSILENALPVRVVAEASRGLDALAAVHQLRPDALLLSMATLPRDRLDVLAVIARLTRVLAFADPTDYRLLGHSAASGLSAFLVHGEYTVDDLRRAVLDGRPGRPHLSRSVPAWAHSDPDPLPKPRPLPKMSAALLSPREREIMDHIARGLSNGTIACLLHLREKTVKNHINRIFTKLCVSSRAQAIVLWLSEHRGAGVHQLASSTAAAVV